MADIFDVVADSTRRDILRVLLERSHSGSGDISVGGLVEHLGLSQPTVSKHLKVLRDHGLVAVREEGQHRYYSLDASPLSPVREWVGDFVDTSDDAPDVPAFSVEANASPAFSAWAGSEVGETIGRRMAESSHQARAVADFAVHGLHDATEALAGRLPKAIRGRLPGAR